EWISATLRAHDLEVVIQLHNDRTNWRPRVEDSSLSAILIGEQVATSRDWNIVNSLQNHPSTRHVPIIGYSFHLNGVGDPILELNYHSLPLDLEQLAHILHQPATEPASLSTILIVDDDPDIL